MEVRTGGLGWHRGLELVFLQSFPRKCLICAGLAEPVSERGIPNSEPRPLVWGFIEEIGVRVRTGFGKDRGSVPH